MSSREVHLVDQVLDTVGGRAEADATAFVGNEALTRFANSFIHQNVAEYIEAVSLRVAVDGRVASARTTRTDGDSLRGFVESTLETARRQPVDGGWPGLAPPDAPPVIDHVDEETYDASPIERASRVKTFVDQGNGMRAAGYCSTEGTSVAFANTAGQHATGRYSRAILDGIHQTDTSAGTGHAAGRGLADLDAEATGALAARRAHDSAETLDAKPGEYEVVLAPDAVGTIAIFLAFYGFNGKTFGEGRSFADIGVTQFDERFSMWDDAADRRALGVTFDTEGTVKQRTDLVADGVTVGMAHDRRTAANAGVASTGHHHPDSDVWGPVGSNIFLANGGESADDLIAGVGRGLYVSTFNYCRVLDPKTLVVTGLTRNGTFMIENGAITGAVSNLRFTQSFVDALGPGRLLGIGDDGRFADSDFGAGFVHVPSMRLGAWHFTGGVDG